MGLPKLDIQRFKHKLTGIDKTITYRPFTVKEQKILLMAKESEEREQEIEAMCQIIELCTDGAVDPKELPIFDIEDLFIKIRSKSVSDVCEIGYRVKDSDEHIKISIPLDEVKVHIDPSHQKKFMITETLGLVMKYPTLGMAFDSDSKIKQDDSMIRACIDYVFDEDQVYNFSDFSEEEINEWIESFDTSILKKIANFFATMPTVKWETEVELSDGRKTTIEFKGINSFFG
jgi:hypothetical protein